MKTCARQYRLLITLASVAATSLVGITSTNNCPKCEGTQVEYQGPLSMTMYSPLKMVCRGTGSNRQCFTDPEYTTTTEAQDYLYQLRFGEWLWLPVGPSYTYTYNPCFYNDTGCAY